MSEERLADLLAHPTLQWPGNKRLNMRPGNPWWANWEATGYHAAFGEWPPDWVYALDDALLYRVLAWAVRGGGPLPDSPPGRLPSRTCARAYPWPHSESLEKTGPVPVPERRRTMVLHIPHASMVIPPHRRAALKLADAELADELRRMTDHRTALLFPVTDWEAERVIAPVSRLVVDVERFADDADEPMAAVGMGAIYERTHNGARLRSAPTALERADLLAEHYWPHHDALTLALGRVVHAMGTALVVDCHSFPDLPMPHEPDHRVPRPDLCIGTSERTPDWAVDTLMAVAAEAGLTVAVNVPFTGAMTPRAFTGDGRVSAVMIEVNRRLYLDETSARPGAGFNATQELLVKALNALGRRAGALPEAGVAPPAQLAMPLSGQGTDDGADRGDAGRASGGGDDQPP